MLCQKKIVIATTSYCRKQYFLSPLKIPATVAGCGGNHHSLLHISPNTFVGRVWPKEMGVIYRFLPVHVQLGAREVDCHALFVCGSSLSFISRRVADALGVPAPDKAISVSWMDDGTKSVLTKEMNLSVRDAEGNWRSMNCLATDPKLPKQTISKKGLQQLGIDAEVSTLDNVKPDILIGLKNGHLSRIIDCQPSACNSVGAVKTVLVCCLEGSVSPATWSNWRN